MKIKRNKVSVIGAGFTGATTAFMIAQKELADVVLVDIPNLENSTKGKALDMFEAAPVMKFDARIHGTSSYLDTALSDVVIITAGLARKPGMSRDDLVSINVNIMKNVTEQIIRYSPNCIIIVLTNPVDVMTYTVYKASGFPKNRIMGQSGILDTARFRRFVADELDISVKDVTGFVLGGHGDMMVPLIRYSYAGGIPIEQLLSPKTIEDIVKRTRMGGGEIVNLLGNGSAYYAPSASLTEMTEAILKDQRRILPSIAYLEGEYGCNDIFLGVPTIIGGNGIEKVIELALNENEKKSLDASITSVQSILNKL